MIKKFFSVCLAIVITLSLFSISPRSVHASNHPSWHWTQYEVSPNVYIDIAVDNRCDDANPAFRVTVFEGPNQTGARARLCGYWDDLEDLPQYKGAPATKTFNNSISSIWVKDLPTSGNYFVLFSMLKDQEGDSFPAAEAKFNVPSEYNNKISSIKRVLYPY